MNKPEKLATSKILNQLKVFGLLIGVCLTIVFFLFGFFLSDFRDSFEEYNKYYYRTGLRFNSMLSYSETIKKDLKLLSNLNKGGENWNQIVAKVSDTIEGLDYFFRNTQIKVNNKFIIEYFGETRFQWGKFKKLTLDSNDFMNLELSNLQNEYELINERIYHMYDLMLIEGETTINKYQDYMNRASLFIFLLLGGVMYLGALYYWRFFKQVSKMLDEDEERKIVMATQSRLASLGEMASGFAHEINNPLTIITANLAVLKKMNEKGKMTGTILLDSVEKMEETVRRIAKIIKGLRSISRKSDENDPFEEVEIGTILDYALGSSQEKIKVEGIKLIVDIPDEIMKTNIYIQQVQLSQVFLNILSNSLDAIENLEDKWIKITAKELRNAVEFRFEDSGSGIPIEIQDKMFEPFFTTKEIGKGTGLGLPLCKTIVERHNGQFYIDNTKENTCFVITVSLEVKEYSKAS